MGRKVKESSKLEVGSIYKSKYYGDMEVIEDMGSRAVTVKFLSTGYIKYLVVRGNILKGKVKDPSVKRRSNDVNIKVGTNTINSYLDYKGTSTDMKHIYHCKLCGDDNKLVKKYSECNIPLSCGCIQRLKPQTEDLTGKTFNDMLVYGYMSDGFWKIKYSCGHFGKLKTSVIKAPRSTSLCKDCAWKIPTTLDHGHAKRSGYSSEYTSWLGMKARCEKDNHNRYEFYKGKGITYPEEWKNFNVFLRDMGYKPYTNYTIERLNIDLPYSKENCVWASNKTQANNKSSNILIVKEGVDTAMSLKHWCDLEGIDYKSAHYRFKYKSISVEDILGVNYSLKINLK